MNAQKLDFAYYFFGLTLRSNLALPGVSVSNLNSSSFDLDLRLGIAPTHALNPSTENLVYESSFLSETGEPGLRIWEHSKKKYLRLAYYDGTQFWIESERKNLWATWPENLSLENTASYLLGPVFGLLLRLRGVTCLHASAVVVEGTCIVFVGPAGAGKSTTAAAFAKAGFAVLSDDIVAFSERNGHFDVLPAYPHICLWPESVEMLYGNKEMLPRFTLDCEKRCLALGTNAALFESSALPLGAIYLLYPRQPANTPSIERLRPQDAFIPLVTNTYATNVLDSEMRAKEFADLGRLIADTPIYKVAASEDPHRLDEFRLAILNHYLNSQH